MCRPINTKRGAIEKMPYKINMHANIFEKNNPCDFTQVYV